MGTIKIKKGLNLSLKGEPEQVISDGHPVDKVALIGYDYPGMKPTMKVAVGDDVKAGQLLFTDKKMEGINYTSPGTGKVISINRGLKRAFESIVIRLEGDEYINFKSFGEDKLGSLKRDDVKELLLESGQWTSLRERPYGKVADPEVIPNSIFVTAMDTNPLAPSIVKIIEGKEKDIENGLKILSLLTDGKIFFCKDPELNIALPDIGSLCVEEFSGPHPAGLPGTHIHFLDPAGPNKRVWHIGVQDVIAISRLFLSGKLYFEKIISISGPSALSPKLIRTRTGADIESLIAGEVREGDNAVISGSVLEGRRAEGNVGYLGKFHQQITVLREGKDRKFFGWLGLGFNSFSVKNILISSLLRRKKFDLTTSMEGGKRAIIPVENYDAVMPLDIVPAYLLRALAVDDIEEAEKLGCLELIEEDLALCTFVCASKNDYGSILRRNLTIIEKEG
ncbi:MAG: Na(+)-translocating NADH-quinone reductase subunit A [Acidobacteriota bacterium]